MSPALNADDKNPSTPMTATHPTEDSQKRQTLSESLQSALAMQDDHLTVSDLAKRVGDRGFGLLLLILSLPSALPVPAPGYSVPFGILLLILAVQMLIGRQHPAFPKAMAMRRISRKNAQRFIASAIAIFHKLEWIIRPRLRWIGYRGGRLLMGALVAIMAILMMIPIPLTNTFPAIVIFLIGVGLTEEDGLFVLAACAIGVFAVCLYGALIWAIWAFGPEVIDLIKDTIRSWLGRSS